MCMSREETDSIQALVETSNEMAKLLKWLHHVVSSNPVDAHNRIKSLRPTPSPERTTANNLTPVKA